MDILPCEIDDVIVAANRLVSSRLPENAKTILAKILTRVFRSVGDLSPSVLVATLNTDFGAGYRFSDDQAFSLRRNETDHWLGKYDFLIIGLRNMVMVANDVGLATYVRIDMATVFVLVGYAIRVNSDAMAAS